ncbi:MAG: protease modulator HflC [Omnitrophica bacterium]|nr:protease modulator HflC [Candidatus Omnitrophota bacterium]
MNKNTPIILVVVVLAALLFANPFYIVKEGQQAIITMFGEPKRQIRSAGLKFKIPLVEKVNYFEQRILEWDGYPTEIPTKDKRYIWIDTTARWKIVDPLKFFQSVSNERGAQAILDGIIDASVRDAVTSQKLIEFVRSSNRLVERQKDLKKDKEFIDAGAFEIIKMGRDEIRKEIIQKAQGDLGPRYGIELLDLRIKRANYVEDVRRKVYDRMIAERNRAAAQYRSEGRGIRAEVEGRTQKELKAIQSEAYRQAQEIKGEADGKAAKIYADAYSRDQNFYSFLKTLDTYKNTIDKDTVIIMTTEGDYFKYLDQISP